MRKHTYAEHAHEIRTNTNEYANRYAQNTPRQKHAPELRDITGIYNHMMEIYANVLGNICSNAGGYINMSEEIYNHTCGNICSYMNPYMLDGPYTIDNILKNISSYPENI